MSPTNDQNKQSSLECSMTTQVCVESTVLYSVLSFPAVFENIKKKQDDYDPCEGYCLVLSGYKRVVTKAFFSFPEPNDLKFVRWIRHIIKLSEANSPKMDLLEGQGCSEVVWCVESGWTGLGDSSCCVLLKVFQAFVGLLVFATVGVWVFAAVGDWVSAQHAVVCYWRWSWSRIGRCCRCRR